MTDTTTTTTTSAASVPPDAPWWRVLMDRLAPDFRAWVALGVFGMAFYILQMIKQNPTLLSNASFMQMVGMIVGGSGVGVIVLFCFGGTKTGSEVMSAQSKVVAQAASAPAPPPDTSTTTTTTATPEPDKKP